MAKNQFAIAFTFFLVIAHMFRRRKHMLKSLVWKGFLSESMWGEDYNNLSLFSKFVFWVNYPFSYAKFLWVVVWDRIDRLSFRNSRAVTTKTRIKTVEITYSDAFVAPALKKRNINWFCGDR
jgi:hypothetical protein